MLEIGKKSYISVDEADEYFLGRLGADFWETLDKSHKEKALVTATRKIDTLPFVGYKQNPKQPLQFPRFYYTSCNLTQTDFIPQSLKDAVCEEALTTLQYIESNSEEVYNGAIQDNYQTLKLGDASITYGGSNNSNTSSNLLSETAKHLLSGLIKTGFDIQVQRYYEAL